MCINTNGNTKHVTKKENLLSIKPPPDAQFSLNDLLELGIDSPLNCFIAIFAIAPEPKSTKAYPALILYKEIRFFSFFFFFLEF